MGTVHSSGSSRTTSDPIRPRSLSLPDGGRKKKRSVAAAAVAADNGGAVNRNRALSQTTGTRFPPPHLVLLLDNNAETVHTAGRLSSKRVPAPLPSSPDFNERTEGTGTPQRRPTAIGEPPVRPSILAPPPPPHLDLQNDEAMASDSGVDSVCSTHDDYTTTMTSTKSEATTVSAVLPAAGHQTEIGCAAMGKKRKKRSISAKRIVRRLRSLSLSKQRSESSTPVPQEGEKPSSAPMARSYLNREWEIVTYREMCRRLSLESLDGMELPIPEGAQDGQVLDQLMIRQLMEILPARAEGYPWVLIYSSEKHGFALSTLYRKMAEWGEDLSPVLLIVRDVRDSVFGAVVSSAIRPMDQFYGTGDSCLLWRFTGKLPHTRELRSFAWSGDNQFFVNATKQALAVGAGAGHFGLWLDQDLNKGRSQRCATFDNEPLAGDDEEFVIKSIEAFGFRV